MSSTVAIVNWNSGRRLRICIESLLGTTTKAEILVVDNASDDDSMEMIQGFRNRVNIISNSVNRGFAGAINQAFQTTDTPYVLVLNPDVRVLPGAVSSNGRSEGYPKSWMPCLRGFQCCSTAESAMAPTF